MLTSFDSLSFHFLSCVCLFCIRTNVCVVFFLTVWDYWICELFIVVNFLFDFIVFSFCFLFRFVFRLWCMIGLGRKSCMDLTLSCVLRRTMFQPCMMCASHLYLLYLRIYVYMCWLCLKFYLYYFIIFYFIWQHFFPRGEYYHSSALNFFGVSVLWPHGGLNNAYIQYTGQSTSQEACTSYSYFMWSGYG